MIDTVKIGCKVDYNVYEIIYNLSTIKTSFNSFNGEVHYIITSNSLKGSFDSSLSVMVKIHNNKPYIFIEGSLHKIKLGHNAYNGIYDFQNLCMQLVDLVENAFNVKLPNYNNFEVFRVDITKTFDFKFQDRVKQYINNISLCEFGRKRKKIYPDECIYFSGQVSTFKIYNKLLEFNKNDSLKLKKLDFDLLSFQDRIKGYIRFECEIRKKKLKDLFNLVLVKNIKYDILLKEWESEYMNIYKICKNDFYKIYKKDEVKDRIYGLSSSRLAPVLYGFYCELITDGYKKTRLYQKSKTTFYRKLKQLKELGIDFNQAINKINIVESNYIDLDIFKYKEVE